MRLSRKLEWFFGVFFGLLTPLFGVAVFLQIYPMLQAVDNWYDPAWQLILVRLATFGVMLNALVFFIALRFNKESIAKGVLWACGVYLVPLLILQFLR